jgi:hypothetical protein
MWPNGFTQSKEELILTNPKPETADRRMRFRNMQLLAPGEGGARSRVTQFISTNANIGNYMPVKAIQNMLGEETDVWNMHRPIDWDFVNSNYKAAVIGGAGLLAKAFNKFWVDCAANCKIPIIVWGVGTCIVDGLPLEDTICDREPVRSIFERALMVNVRDELTAELYGGAIQDKISITACPTIYYLQDFEVVAEPKTVTLSVHPDLVDDETHDAIEAVCVSKGFTVLRTLNVQTTEQGLEDIIRDYYCRSDLVIATRLHGAIAAYGLGIPYLAMPGDEKLREFHRLFGGGKLFNNMVELAELLGDAHAPLARPDLAAVLDFGVQAKDAIELLP